MRYILLFLVFWTLASHALLGVHVRPHIVHHMVHDTKSKIKKVGHKAFHSATKTVREAVLPHHSADRMEDVLRLIADIRHH
jgi:hypothetical protein